MRHRRTVRVGGSRANMPRRPRRAGLGVYMDGASAGAGAGAGAGALTASPPVVLTGVLAVTLTVSASMRSISQSAGLVSWGSGTPAAASK